MVRNKNVCLAIIEFIGGLNSKINVKIKCNIMTGLMTVLILSSILFPVATENSFSIVVLIGISILLIYIGLFIKSESIVIYKIKKRYFALYIVVGGSFFINGIYFGIIGYMAISIIFALLLPIFYKTMASFKDNKMIFKAMSRGVIIAFCIFSVLSMLFGPPLSKTQYFSFLVNPNTFGAFMAITAASSLYLLDIKLKTDATPIRIVLLMILVASSLSLCFLSNARTCLLCVLMQFTIYIIKYVVTAIREKKVLKALKLGGYMLAINVAVFFTIFFLLTTVKGVIMEYVTIANPNEDQNISITDTLNIGADRLDKGLKGEGSDSFTSGRIGIWKDYINEISIMGHQRESRDIVSGTRVYKDTNAHNAYLQVAYSAGLIAGVSMLTLVILMGASLLKKAFKFLADKKCNLTSEIMFVASIYLTFLISSITSGGYLAFTYLHATLFWLVSFAIITKQRRPEAM